MIPFVEALRRTPLSAFAAMLMAASSLQAAPVSFGISSASITAGSSYGIDTESNPENGGKLLDVRFVNTFVTQAFSLTHVGDSVSFDLATVNFAEPDIGDGGNLGIRKAETNDIVLTTNLSFNNPLGGVVNLAALVTANIGSINDAEVDYAIAWKAVETDIGDGGRFRLSVGPLSFSNNGMQTARATVELLSVPGQGLTAAAVPEPTSLALAAVALAGAGVVRRRRPR